MRKSNCQDIISSETYQLYIRDLVYLLKEELNKRIPTNNFEEGKKFEIESVIDLIESQAFAFKIDLNEMGFYEYEKYQNMKH